MSGPSTSFPPSDGKPAWHPGQVLVLQALHRAERASRAELAQVTGFSAQSLTRITAELIAGGYVEEVARRSGRRGQPAIELALSPNRLMSVGLVLEHDRITCIVGDIADATLRRTERSGDFLSAEATAEAAERLVSEALQGLPQSADLLGIGVSQSGFFYEPGTQRIVSRNDVAGWSRLDLAQRLRTRFGVDVTVENDGCAAAVGHTIHGVGTAFRSFFLVLLTRGVGGGVVDDRRLLRGHLGNAGELAMLMPSDPAAIRPTTESLHNWLAAAWGHAPAQSEIDDGVVRGDGAVMEWLAVAGSTLDRALASVTALLDPEAVILAGRLSPIVRTALAERLRIVGPGIGSVVAPAPRIVVDPASDCLELGAAALPVARFFGWERTRAQPV